MAGRFLRAAFQVLDQEHKPLTANRIVDIASKYGYLPTKGKTPNNTMRARLSDEIRRNGSKSFFQRTGSNRFGLREWNFVEFHARPFKKEVPNEVTVCLPGTVQDEFGEGKLGYTAISNAFVEYLSCRDNLTYLDRRTAETTSKYKQLVAYVWLESCDGLVLTYTRGKYSSAHQTLLLGRRSVGFGGHVLQQDADSLFSNVDAGVEQAAVREIGEELGGLLPSLVKPLGVIWDDSSFEGQKHIGIVMKGTLARSDEVNLNAGERSINKLEFVTKHRLWTDFHTMEFWSQLLIIEFAKRERISNISAIVPTRRPKKIKCLILVGEIANGKSSIAAGISKSCGIRIVSASSVLRDLLGVNHVEEQDRVQFQNEALKFIKTESGPKSLANGIADQVKKCSDEIVLIDGIRQLDTLNLLREMLQDLVVVFVDCPRNTAYSNYRKRRSDATVLDFAAVREHKVESELPLFRYESDAILSNADSLTKTIDIFTEWLKQGTRL